MRTIIAAILSLSGENDTRLNRTFEIGIVVEESTPVARNFFEFFSLCANDPKRTFTIRVNDDRDDEAKQQ